MDPPSGPTLNDIVQILKVPEDQIVYAFIAGSRLFGISRPDSDWDIYVILDGFVGPLKPSDESPSPGLLQTLITVGEWDLNVYVKSYWQHLLDLNVV